MSPSMEFLIADVATRSPLMSFVKDNYDPGGMAREGRKCPHLDPNEPGRSMAPSDVSLFPKALFIV